MSDSKRHEILRDRAKTYGRSQPISRRLGRIWRSLIEHHFDIELPGDIPPHLLDLMMASMKIMRTASAKLPFHEDNYTDALNYIDIARDEDPRNPQAGELFDELERTDDRLRRNRIRDKGAAAPDGRGTSGVRRRTRRP